MGGSGHSFHCVRARPKSEETVNGHLEDGENICLWRHGGLVIPQRDSRYFFCSFYVSFLGFFFCRYSFCFGFFKGLESGISSRITSFQKCFPSSCASTSFSLRPRHVFHSTTRRTPRLACLHLPVRTSSSVPSCSVWDGALAQLQASCPFQTYENAARVRCHVRISWTRLHISKRVAPLAPSLDCRPASVKLAPYISSAPATCIRLYGVYFRCCTSFSHSELWGHKEKYFNDVWRH